VLPPTGTTVAQTNHLNVYEQLLVWGGGWWGGWTLEIQPPGKQQKLQSRSENLLSHPHQKGISLPLKCNHSSHLIGIMNQVVSSHSISQPQYESKIVCCRYKSCSRVPETVGSYSNYVPLQNLRRWLIGSLNNFIIAT